MSLADFQLHELRMAVRRWTNTMINRWLVKVSAEIFNGSSVKSKLAGVGLRKKNEGNDWFKTSNVEIRKCGSRNTFFHFH